MKILLRKVNYGKHRIGDEISSPKDLTDKDAADLVTKGWADKVIDPKEEAKRKAAEEKAKKAAEKKAKEEAEIEELEALVAKADELKIDATGLDIDGLKKAIQEAENGS